MTNQVEYTSLGTNAVYPFPFAITVETDCQVLIGGVVQSGNYSVRGQGSIDGGAVVFDDVPVAGAVITIRRQGEIALSSADPTGGYLADKLVAGENIALATVIGEGGVQKLAINATGLLKSTSNLGDLADKDEAREKLGVYGKGAVYTQQEVNDRDVAVAEAAQANLANLTGVDVPAALTKLGLDDVAYLNVAQDWTAPQRSHAVFDAQVGGSVALNLAQYQNLNLILTANVTFANPTLTTDMVGQKGTIGITPAGFAIADMGSQWKRVGTTGKPDVITGIGRIDYHIRALDRIEYAYNDVEA